LFIFLRRKLFFIAKLYVAVGFQKRTTVVFNQKLIHASNRAGRAVDTHGFCQPFV